MASRSARRVHPDCRPRHACGTVVTSSRAPQAERTELAQASKCAACGAREPRRARASMCAIRRRRRRQATFARAGRPLPGQRQPTIAWSAAPNDSKARPRARLNARRHAARVFLVSATLDRADAPPPLALFTPPVLSHLSQDALVELRNASAPPSSEPRVPPSRRWRCQATVKSGATRRGVGAHPRHGMGPRGAAPILGAGRIFWPSSIAVRSTVGATCTPARHAAIHIA